MYVEFRLPTGAGGMAAQYTYGMLSRNLRAWSEQYSIPHQKKLVKYIVKVTFDNDESYSFFALTWQPNSDQFSSYLTNYRLVEPMNRV